MKVANPEKGVAYRGVVTAMADERKDALAGLLKAIEAGERKEIQLTAAELDGLRELQKVVKGLRPVE